MSTPLVRVDLFDHTLYVVEVGIEADGLARATGYNLTEFAPIPRRQIIAVLRQLCDELEQETEALNALEPQL